MSASRDWSKTSTNQLLSIFRFHENDRGTMTMFQEVRRMAILDEIAVELKRRGVAAAA